LKGQLLQNYREKGETYDIYVRLEEYSRANLEDIENLPIVLPGLEEKTQVFAARGPGCVKRRNYKTDKTVQHCKNLRNNYS
jgi:Cu/Ag efflux pump CusA